MTARAHEDPAVIGADVEHRVGAWQLCVELCLPALAAIPPYASASSQRDP